MAEIYEKYIKKGKSFELTTSEKEDVIESLRSTILGVEKDSYIISIPKRYSKSYSLETGKLVNIYLYAEDGIYKLKCEVMEAGKDYYRVAKAVWVEHSQRREYARAGIKLNIKVALQEKNGEIRYFNFKSNNLCAKGVNFNANEKLYQAGRIFVEFLLNGRVIKTYAILAYSTKHDTLSGTKYSTALNFTSISQQDIDFITKECLLHQLKNRQKEAKNFG